MPENPRTAQLSDYHADRKGRGDGQNHRPDHGGGRLYDQAFPTPGDGGQGEGPAAPLQKVQHRPAAGGSSGDLRPVPEREDP